MQAASKSGIEQYAKSLKVAGLAALGVAALSAILVPSLNRSRRAADQAATGLAENTESESYQDRLITHLPSAKAVRRIAGGVVGGVPGPVMVAGLSATPPAMPREIPADRRMVRTDTLDLVVKTPAESAENIRQLADRVGGFVETSQVSGEQDATNASLTIHVPSARFEEVRTEIRQLGLRVENERLDAQDVTKQYVDQEARLRNLRAEEAQYLSILKRAANVSDTLEVSDKLNEVRGEIEQQQAEFDALSKQVETVAITISLRAEAETRVFGLHWRPLYQLKQAAHDGLTGLGDYAATMATVIFYLPAAVLWLGTILLGLAVGFRIVRWAALTLFPFRRKKAQVAPVS